MIGSIARSKNFSEKNKMRYKNLKFFVSSSKNRLQKIKSGCRLVSVINQQREENEEPLQIIESYLHMEKGALKLIKTSKGIEDNKPEDNPKHRQEKVTRSQAQPDYDQYPEFDFQDYFKTKQFNPVSEIQKERNLEHFFRQRYEIESKGLAEENLKSFLEHSPQSMIQWDTSRGAYGLKEEPSSIATFIKEKRKDKDARLLDIREPILKQMEMLDEEIRLTVAREIQVEKDKAYQRKAIQDHKMKHLKLQTDSPSKMMNSSGNIGLQNSGMRGRLSVTEDDASSSLLMPQLVSKIEKLYNGDLKESKQITRTKKIISDLLDHGRKDFIKSHKLPKTPNDFHAKSIHSLMNSKQLTSSAGFKLESIIPFSQSEAQPQKAINNINLFKLDTHKSTSSSLYYHQTKNYTKIPSNPITKRQSILNEFNGCKLFQMNKTASNFSNRAETLKQEKSNVAGVDALSHNGINSLRFLHSKGISSPSFQPQNQFPHIQAPKTVSNFVKDNNNSGDPFLQRVQSEYIDMKEMWRSNPAYSLKKQKECSQKF